MKFRGGGVKKDSLQILGLQRLASLHMEINFIDAYVDVGTNATTLVLLMDSDVAPVYVVLLSCTYSMICDNCSETELSSFKVVFLILGFRK